MSIDPDFNIWIIEDVYQDTVDYYLDPLEKIAERLSHSHPHFRFPPITAVLLGLDPTQQQDCEQLQARIRKKEVYVRTNPHLSLNPRHEIDEEEFFDYLNHNLREQDVVLIDPTAHGSQWWPGQDHNYSQSLLYIYDKIRAKRKNGNRNRLKLLSHQAKLPLRTWQEIQDNMIPKLTKDDDAYRDCLYGHLEPFLFPKSDWTRFLNMEGEKILQPYVNELRANTEGRSALATNIGQCAAMAMRQVLTPSRNCARDLVDATGKKSVYADPLAIQTQVVIPQNLLDQALYRTLIRRRALYGLRQLWLEQVPNERRDDEAEYKLWLEVVAGGYRWYWDERSAIEGIYRLMKDKVLTLGPLNSIDLMERGLNYKVLRNEVKTVRLYAAPEYFRYQAESKGILRFFEGKFMFIVKGQRSGTSEDEKAKASFEVRYSGADQIPEHGSPAAQWDKFWARPHQLGKFHFIRHGHVEKMQKELINRWYFKDISAMLRFPGPMPEEEAWWKQSRAQFEEWLGALRDRYDGFDVFSPGDQSDEGWYREQQLNLKKHNS